MSRSYKKSPAGGRKNASEKKDKQFWHRKFRRQNKQRVQRDLEPLLVKEITNLWVMSKDGKQYWNWSEKDKHDSEYYTKEQRLNAYLKFLRK
jgi:Fe-S cluster assembly scaffold protein SufB